MKYIEKILILFVLNLMLSSCGGSDVIVKVYDAYEYNCTEHEVRILSEITTLPFLETEKWYSREEFHNAYIDAAKKEISKDPVSKLLDLSQLPLQDISNALWYEIIMYVDCENQRVIED
tara:strand:+ start:359 stop:715 length:357 start_codon:yes stop_codon:yes gene_type:complete